jgi:protein-disulfide isomerase
MIQRLILTVALMSAVWLPLDAEQEPPSGRRSSKPSPKKDCCVLELPGFPVANAVAGGAKTTVIARHVEGNPKSVVRVLIYEDLQCPDCSVFRKALDERLLPRYRASVAFEHRDFPLPKHTWAKEAAAAARYFQALDPKLAADFRRTVQGNLGKVNAEGFRSSLIEFCQDQQLDTDKALAALSNSTYAQAVEADFQAGIAAGIRRTPTVIVGGKSFVETIDIVALQRSLDALLGGTSGSQ